MSSAPAPSPSNPPRGYRHRSAPNETTRLPDRTTASNFGFVVFAAFVAIMIARGQVATSGQVSGNAQDANPAGQIDPIGTSPNDGTIPTPPPVEAVDPWLAELQQLPELPLRHETWPNTPELYYTEVARILGSASINLHSPAGWRRSLAKGTGLPVVAHYSPNDGKGRTPELLAERLQEAVAYGLQIDLVVVDSEWLSVTRTDRFAIAEYHDRVGQAIDSVLPSVAVEWYQHQGETLSSSELGWSVDDNTVGTEPGWLAVSLYRPQEFEATKRQITTTAERSIKVRRGKLITVWLTTQGCYQRTRSAETGKWAFGCPEYTVEHAYIWGRWLNNAWYHRQDPERYGRLGNIGRRIFYDSPFADRAGDVGKQRFVAYVRGAAGLN